MKIHKESTSVYIAGLLIIGLMISCGKTPEQKGAKVSENQPVQSEGSVATDKYFFEADSAALSALKQGDTYVISVPEQEKAFDLKVQRVQETIPGITSISANIVDRETGLATLMWRDGRLSGTLDLYKENLKYTVQFDTSRKAHFIRELKAEETKELEGGEPLKTNQY